MKKQIKELVKGDVFLDSFGIPLEFEKAEEIPWSGIPRTKPKMKVFFKSGDKSMVMNFNADRLVEIK